MRRCKKKNIGWLVNSLPSIFSSLCCSCVAIILFPMAEEEMSCILLVELLLWDQVSFDLIKWSGGQFSVSVTEGTKLICQYPFPSLILYTLISLWMSNLPLYYYFSFLFTVSFSKNTIIQVFKRYNMSIRIIGSSDKCKVTLINTYHSLNV